MPPKASSATKSSNSATSKLSSGKFVESGLQTPIQFVKGVGPKLGSIFKSRGVETVRDLLYFFPREYEDRQKLKRISDVIAGEKATVALEIISTKRIPVRFGKSKFILETRCKDSSGVLSLKWFHVFQGLEVKLKTGAQILATGVVKEYRGLKEIIHPDISWSTTASTEAIEPAVTQHIGRTIPIYTEIEGVSTKLLRTVLWNALDRYIDQVHEDLPEELLKKYALPRLNSAIYELHFPSDKTSLNELSEFKTLAHQRLIYEEFLKFQFMVLKNRSERQFKMALPVDQKKAKTIINEIIPYLPYTLTGDQKKAIADILGDLEKPHPMNRLIQGDVGSGKTIVSLLTAAGILGSGYQAALMAPTEILAEQHLKNAKICLGGRFPVYLLTGKTSAKEKKAIIADLATGEPALVIGTHALIEDPVKFENLALIMIDEQHRFGVEQRRALRQKSKIPSHLLILTATPIPRTLALTAYGELHNTQIKEMPPGRMPVNTRVITVNQRNSAWAQIREELKKSRQAYVVCPLVSDSETEGFEDLKSVETEVEYLSKEVFPDFKVGLLHGKMKSEEKNRVMNAFKAGEIHILVSTTVIEVGVDVPNASIIIIEHAERFGLSQLHQLRGRVGRGSHASLCLLMTGTRVNEWTEKRLSIMEKTTDGFKIAEADLEWRGPGEFLGTRQAGALPFKLANLVRDQKWLELARTDAEVLIEKDPTLSSPEHKNLRQFFIREGSVQLDRLKTS
ncbi:MAG: ATP-dependent DNA helicase RecG [Xanthomonadaceae bacterium]|nr:ATP-dependent DNA helicase RecG [Xanthomonadaceae bacterium]